MKSKLRKLDEDCWKIFARKAGKHKDKNKRSRKQLKEDLQTEVRDTY